MFLYFIIACCCCCSMGLLFLGGGGCWECHCGQIWEVILRLGASPMWTLLQVSWKTPEHSLWRKLSSSPTNDLVCVLKALPCVPLLCLILSKSIFLFRISHKDKSEICASFSHLLHPWIAWTQIFLGGIIVFDSRAVIWDEHDKYRTHFYLQSEGKGRRKKYQS